MTGKALLIGAAGAAAIIAAGSANAQVALTEGSGWQVFEYYDGVGSSIGEYTFTVTGPGAKFWIADGYNAGDEFAISINGGPLIDTSTSLYDPYVYNPLYYIGDDWDAAFWPSEAPYFSHLSLVLPDGTYDITGIVTQTTLTEFGIFSCCGAGAVELTAVPEPAGWALMLLGFGVLGAALRRREKAPAEA